MRELSKFTRGGKAIRAHFSVLVSEHRPGRKVRHRRFTIEPDESEAGLAAEDVVQHIKRALVGGDDGA